MIETVTSQIIVPALCNISMNKGVGTTFVTSLHCFVKMSEASPRDRGLHNTFRLQK